MSAEYKYGAVSSNDPNQMPMKYRSREEAQQHADLMNKLIETWEENQQGLWNKDHWRVKPEPWTVKELENGAT